MPQTEPSTPPPRTTSRVGRPDIRDPDYPRFIRFAPLRSLSAESLAADYRAACEAALDAARNAAAERLFAADADLDRDEGFLRVAWMKAREIAKERPDLGLGVVETKILDEILETLPTDRGGHAEVDWDSFCFQRSLDVYRYLTAKKRLAQVHDQFPEGYEPRSDGPAPDIEPFEGSNSCSPEFMKKLRAIVDRAVVAIPDPELRLVTHDQLGPEPSKHSGTKWRSESGKPSLLMQLGWEQTETNRYRVYRMVKRGRAIVRAETLKAIDSGELEADPAFLHDWLAIDHR